MKTRNLILAAIFLAPFSAYATGGDEFDQPPLTLGESLDFLPGKSLGEIFLETSPELKTPGTVPNFEREVNAIADRLRTEAPATLVKTADDLLAQARSHYATAKWWCPLLHDVRDVLVASSADRAAAADFIKWRVAKRESFGFAPEKRNKEEEEKASPAPQVEAEVGEKAKAAKGPLQAHFLFLVGATTFVTGDREACRPWFERVVKEFPKHPRAEAAQFLLARCSFFDSRKGVDPYASSNAEDDRKRAKLRLDAQVLFERFRTAYPHGRFDADALGWLGALAFDGGNYLKALDYYIAQAETPGHPETLKSAVFMCEECLVRIASQADAPAAYALVARHPRIAMGFAYLVLSAPEADNYDGKFDQPAAVKKWRRTVLPKIAAAVAQQKDLYKAGDWQPRYLALLAQAASAAGSQAQALQLTNLSPDQLQKSDDLLLVRAIAFERAKKPAEAIETYRTLLKSFPESTFALGARLRLALALQDNHQAGDAFVELVQLVKTTEPAEIKPAASPTPTPSASASPAEDEETVAEEESDEDSVPRLEPTSELEQGRFVSGTSYPDSLDTWAMEKSAVYPNITGAEFEEIQEAIDTLLNFAPLTELATAVTNDQLAQTARNEVRKVIAERYLAQENFAEAQKFLDNNEAKSIATKLEKLTAAATSASGDKAEQMLQVGNAWAEAHGKLLRWPLDAKAAATNDTSYAERPEHPAEAPVTMLQVNGALSLVHRRENARSIGIKNPDAELAERDELRHASRWWMNAARARPGSPLAAEARWKALEAMPKLARASEYAEQLAREINGEAVSREIYQRLRTESPNSKEATRLAAYWSFPAVEKSNDQSPYVDPTGARDANMMGYPFSDFGALSPPEGEYDSKTATTWTNIEQSVAALRDRAGGSDTAKIASEVRELRDQTQRVIASAGDDYWINLLDDLTQFFSEPNLTPKMQRTYVNIRLDVLHRTNLSERKSPPISTKDTDTAVAAEIEEAQQDPANKPIADYLEMCLLALTAGDRIEVETDIPDAKESEGHAVYLSRDYVAMEKMARDFLAKYPQSKKREAAMFVLARSVHALSRPYLTFASVPLPGAGAKPLLSELQQRSYQREPFDPKRVLGALDNYDREFPQGRYGAEVRNLRAMTLWRMHDWPAALDLTLAQLADATKPELQPEAGVRLANIFAALEDAESRADLLAAIRSRPAAIPLLKKFLDASTADRTHPLRYLTSYLTDQLNLKAVASK